MTSTTEVIDTDGNALPVAAGEGGAITRPADGVSTAEAMARLRQLEGLGFITPVATPEQLREAFALRQRLYAAILAPDDYLYTVSYPDNTGGKARTKQDIANGYENAMERAKALGGIVSAKPLKSGIVKLARALNITAKRKLVKGLPDEPHASYSYVEYEATHEGTGMSEIGVGWCDRGERNRTHDIIATADTRAYGRAVMRLSGFGDVSADEIIAGASEGDTPEYVPEPVASKEADPVPDIDDPAVVAASRSWADTIMSRNGKRYAADAKQLSQNARELRARARRGDARAAQQLGAQGLRWQGTAQDGIGYEPFEVEPAPVSPEAIQAAASAAAGKQAESDEKVTQTQREQEALDRVTGAATPPPSSSSGPSEEKGWNLSNKGSDKDDGDDTPKSLGIPEPDHGTDIITTKQARNVSKLLLELTGGNKDKARQWLADQCHVDRSPSIRLNQYEIILDTLKRQIEKEKEQHG